MASVWISWTSSTAATVVTAATASEDAWGIWTNNTCSSTAGTANAVWYEWNQGEDSGQPIVQVYENHVANWERVARGERQAVDPQVAEEAARQARMKHRLAREAKQRAEELLVANLDDAQAEMFQKERKFHVIGSDGERYEIDTRQHHGNVFRVDEKGKRISGFCAYAQGAVPLGDNALAQKLALETDVARFKEIANQFRVG